MLEYLKELNKSQYEAVVRTEGPALIIAGAGSGKTRVLTYRIAHLLKQGVRPSSILALTFTNKAAREMRERIAKVVGENMARYLWMGTFHSIFARILRNEHEITGYPSNFTIYDSADSRNLIKTIIKSLNLNDKAYKPGVVASRISKAKNNLITPAVYARSTEIRLVDKNMKIPSTADIYREYAKRCFLSGAMDFDDLLLKTNLLFRDHKDVLDKYTERFNYLLVDEYQDTNFAQYQIIKRLSSKNNNLCVVGDDAQSIYSFRGARIENILNFTNDYPHHELFKLEQNYRSTQTIVNVANNIISHNKRQIRKTVFSEKNAGNPIKILSALTDNEEGFMVVQEIAETQLRNHYRNADYAILYRTNAQSRIFEEALRKRNIPYKIYGGLSFYQRKEIKDLLAYFRMVINPADNEALKRIINYPARGIGTTTLTKLENAAIVAETSIWKIINTPANENPAKLNKGTLAKLKKFEELILEFQQINIKNNAFETANFIAGQTGILKDLNNDHSPENISRRENIQELLNGIQEFALNAKEEGMPDKLEIYLEDVALLTDLDTDKEEDRNKVTLMTVHSAKGLEFKNVFIVGLEEKLFPTEREDEKNREASIEEERRLFYVAVTRAEENVWLSFANQRYRWGSLDFCSPSRFLEEINEEYLDKNTLKALQRTGGSRNSTFGQHKQPMFNRREAFKDFRPRSRGGFMVNKQPTSRPPINTQPDFTGDDPNKIQSGMTVEHQRFGEGKVLKTEGEMPNKKATIFFQNFGQKQLLLKFAKLKIKS
ncbi:MAG: ATP-dependent DNA helicase [Draconibacterium sp.]|nr:MAG: ATP-dependent DNA helicase [Draconibacterium sp.]PIF06552.1 MAG: ATP-dependent DNA helicase [Draconibacterium sp.]